MSVMPRIGASIRGTSEPCVEIDGALTALELLAVGEILRFASRRAGELGVVLHFDINIDRDEVPS